MVMVLDMRVTIIFFMLTIIGSAGHAKTSLLYKVESDSISREAYDRLNNQSLTFDAFDKAYTAYVRLKDSLDLKEKYISVVDFSQPSTNKRFYLIDIEAEEVLFQDYVAHGKNTGVLEAKHFSNVLHSNQSSLGCYKTAETYYGKHGLSLRLDGLEEGINHMARKRNIVIHTAKYAEESFIKKYGRLGRSFGCPALPSGNYKAIIKLIKNGTLLFVYAPHQESFLLSGNSKRNK